MLSNKKEQTYRISINPQDTYIDCFDRDSWVFYNNKVIDIYDSYGFSIVTDFWRQSPEATIA